MTAITEDYVSFETAKLLKEKGFDTPIWTRYENDDDNEVIFGDKYNWNNSPMGQISAPTLQMAMKWLREVYNIFICIVLLEDIDGYGFTVENIINKKYIATSKNDGYSTYEEATEAAIKYCLKILI